MNPKRALLTPSLLAWLRCFDAAARCRSFTRAAAELCITQGAVSQQIKQLEAWLHKPLFLRTPGGLTPTPEGQWLSVVVRESLQGLEDTLMRMRATDVSEPLNLSCVPSFAMVWLTPRLGDFYRSHPRIALRVIGEFHGLDRQRMARDGLAAAVRFDPGDYRDLDATEVLDEWLVPVASPAFVAAHPRLRSADRLRGVSLLHDASPWDGAEPFAEWKHWLDHAGVTLPPSSLAQGAQFNLSQLAITAAIAGQGIAMGRLALVLGDLVSGRLVVPFGPKVRSRASYFFVTGQARRETEEVRMWMTAQAAQFRQERDDFLAELVA